MIYKSPNIAITKRYYPKSLVGREPIRYSAKQPNGIGSTVYAIIYLDPILRKHPDLERALMRHEVNEIRAWSTGKPGAHTIAKSKEPKMLRDIGGVSGFWREIARREKRKVRSDVGQARRHPYRRKS